MKKSTYIFAGILLILSASCTEPRAQQHGSLGINENASMHKLGDLPENPLLLRGINSIIQPTDSTLSTLYGNEIAYSYAQSQSDGNYPPGSVLYYVSWKSAADEQWFGANVPDSITAVEQVVFTEGHSAQYSLFKDNKLQQPCSNSENRVAFIKRMKIAN